MTTLISNELTSREDFAGCPHSATEVHQAEGNVDLSATPAADDILDMVAIPPFCKPIDCMVVDQGIDSNAAASFKFTVAMLNSDQTDIVATTEFIADQLSAQNGSIARMNNVNGIKNFTYSRENWQRIGIKVVTAPATFAAGRVKLAVNYKSIEPEVG